MTAAAPRIVERYLEAIANHDWPTLRATLTDDVVRTGPFGDRYAGCDHYVHFLKQIMPTLPGYAMDVHRVTYVDDGRSAFAELSETVTVDGTPITTPEVLVFGLDGDRIARVDIYIQRI